MTGTALPRCATARAPTRLVRGRSGATLLMACLWLPGCGHDTDHPLPADAAVVADPALSEMSALQASTRDAGMLWSVNDSGSLPRLYRLGTDGRAHGRVWLDTWLRDAEALALWPRSDGDWLLVGDVGDNRARRDTIRIHALPEPAADATRARVVWTLTATFPDGPRDVEGMAVDPHDHALLLLSKRELPPRLYRLPLPDADGRPDPAPQPIALLASLPQDMLDGQATGLDIDRSGLRMAVLGYRGLALFTREAGEPWPQALARAPLQLPLPALRKAESVTFSADGQWLLVGSEKRPAPVAAVPLP